MTFEISRNSWHYWIVTRCSSETAKLIKYDSTNINICEYSRWLVWGLLVLICMTGTLSILGTSILLGIIYDIKFLFGIPFGMDFLSNLGRIGNFCLVLISVISGILGAMALADRNREKKAELKAPRPPSFIKTAYRAFKDKFCIKISIKN